MEHIFKKTTDDSKEGDFVADNITKKESLGKGSYATVFEVELEKGEHKMNFALKEYGPQLKNAAEKAFKNYLYAKEIGLKVFRTLRISEDHTALLLTLGNTENNFLISSGSHIEWDKVDHIENFQSLLNDLQQDILKASKASVHYAGDAIFLVADRKQPYNLSFVLGDYDNLIRYDYDSDVNLFPENVVIARNSLKNLLDSYIDEKKIQEYGAEIDESFYKFYKNEKHQFFCTEDNIFETSHGLK